MSFWRRSGFDRREESWDCGLGEREKREKSEKEEVRERERERVWKLQLSGIDNFFFGRLIGGHLFCGDPEKGETEWNLIFCPFGILSYIFPQKKKVIKLFV